MTASDDFYAKAVASNPAPSMDGGASGYFSAPQAGLDPNLFDGDKLHDDVRVWLRNTLYQALTKLGLKAPARWVHIWLAGSGISYQWAADRGNGDLDVLFGVDYPAFLQLNPDWGGMSEEQFAGWLNGQLKSDLWARTAHTQFGEQSYEVTFYLSAGTGRDITQINPYAAYDVRSNAWTVAPTNGTAAEYPQAWHNAASSDDSVARMLIDRHNSIRGQIAMMTPGSAQWHSAGDQLRVNAQQAKALFDDIHGGRHEAFAPGGHGYGDYHNFRWQRAKQTGTIHGLKGILHAANDANAASDTELYGGPIASADEALNRAAMVHSARPGLR